MAGPGTFGPRRELVAQPDVGEGAAHHDLVVPAPGAVGVELPRLDPVLDEVLPGRRVPLDRARRRDVVRGDRVAHPHENTSALDVAGLAGLLRQVPEEGRLPDVRGLRVPFVDSAGRSIERGPVLVSRPDPRVLLLELLGSDGPGHHPLDLVGRRPQFPQEDVAALGRSRERLRREVDVHATGERVRDAYRG